MLRRSACAVAALAAAVVLGTGGSAGAATDSYTQHSVEIGGWNNATNTNQPYAWICNDQSAANSFKFWVWDTDHGMYAWMWQGQENGNDQQGPIVVSLGAGECKFYYFSSAGYGQIGPYGVYSFTQVKVFASSGSNWTFGTDPIAYD